MTWRNGISGVIASASVLATLAMASGADSWMIGLITFRLFR